MIPRLFFMDKHNETCFRQTPCRPFGYDRPFACLPQIQSLIEASCQHVISMAICHGGNANSYYYDPLDATDRFSLVLANPPFNVNAVDKERLKDSGGPGRHFPFGLPRIDNLNYLWIQLFYSALNETGCAGFVMANAASDAPASEHELRRQLIESCAVDVMVAALLSDSPRLGTRKMTLEKD